MSSRESHHNAAAHLIFKRSRDFAPLHDRRFGGGPSHIEGDDVRQRQGTRQGLRTDHPGSRPRFDDVHRRFHRCLGGGEPTIRLHQEQRCGNALALKLLPQRGEIARHNRHDVGIDHRGRGALVLFNLGEDLEAYAAWQIRGPPRDDLFDHQFVSGIGERIQQADRDGLDPLSQQLVDRGFRVCWIKRPVNATMDIYAFIDDDAQIALHQRRWLVPGEIVKPWHAQIADLQDVPEALGGNQAGFSPFQLQDGVRGHRRSMQHLIDAGTVVATFLEHLARPSMMARA